jgi:RNA polymerase sigma-70 factor (ECF subfamily)
LCLRETRRIVAGADADDAAQEALTRVWLNRRACRDPHNPAPWIRQIARREALRLLERDIGRLELPLEVEVAANIPDPDTPLERVIDRIALNAAMAGLPTIDRVLVRLRYGYDLTQSRVAEILRLPEGTAKVRLHRVRARLRRQLGVDAWPG